MEIKMSSMTESKFLNDLHWGNIIQIEDTNFVHYENLQVCRDNDTRGEWFSWIIFLFHSTINNVNTGGDLIYKDKTMTMNYQDCTVYNFYFTYQPSFFLLADDALSKESLRVALLITWPFFPLPSSWLYKNQIITEFFLNSNDLRWTILHSYCCVFMTIPWISYNSTVITIPKTFSLKISKFYCLDFPLFICISSDLVKTLFFIKYMYIYPSTERLMVTLQSE